MNIAMVELSKQQHFVVPEDGKYLVRRPSSVVSVSTDWFSCRVVRHYDPKRNIWVNKFDCAGADRITHVSIRPLP